MSLKPVAPALEKALGHPVTFCIHRLAVSTCCQRQARLRYLDGKHALPRRRRKERSGFANMLGGLGDIFVNDAFSAAHRAHSSTEGIAHVIPAFAGRAMEAELKALQAALEKPTRPLVAVVGGAKVSSKLELLGNLSKVANTIVIGGGMANTFLAAQGYNVGKSLCEHDLIPTAKEILATAKANNCTLLLPVDGVVAKEFKAGAASETVAIDAVPADGMMLDVGAKSIANVKSCFDARQNRGVERPNGSL